jgi:hypothetical protein
MKYPLLAGGTELDEVCRRRRRFVMSAVLLPHLGATDSHNTWTEPPWVGWRLLTLETRTLLLAVKP